MSILEQKMYHALHTLVFETLGRPEEERVFKLKSLKHWGLDLLAGRREGQSAYFVAESGRRRAGDTYSEEGIRYEVEEVIKDLPKKKRFVARIQMIQGAAHIEGALAEGEQRTALFSLPAGALLWAYFKKRKWIHLMEALHNVGSATSLIKHRGTQGRPVPYEALPNVARRFLREARKVEKEAGFGRIALAYYGENKDGDARFWVSWMLPTIALFEEEIARKADASLGAFQ